MAQGAASDHLAPLPKDYKWQSNPPEMEIPPRPFCPTEDNKSENSPDHKNKSRAAIFLEMASESLKHMMKCTNLLGRHIFPVRWVDLTVPTTAKMLGILFHADEHKQSNVRDYWRRVHGDDFVKTSGVSHDTFAMWLACLRLYNPSDITAEQKSKDKAYKVSEYLLKVEKGCQCMYSPPSRHLSLDEEMALYEVTIHPVIS